MKRLLKAIWGAFADCGASFNAEAVRDLVFNNVSVLNYVRGNIFAGSDGLTREIREWQCGYCESRTTDADRCSSCGAPPPLKPRAAFATAPHPASVDTRDVFKSEPLDPLQQVVNTIVALDAWQ